MLLGFIKGTTNKNSVTHGAYATAIKLTESLSALEEEANGVS